MAVYITKRAYFDTIKGIKINSVLPVNLELWNEGAKLTDSTRKTFVVK